MEEEGEDHEEEVEQLLQLKKIPKPEDILARGLQALKTSEHIKFITKSARLEYLGGNPEKGRTLF